MNQTVLKIGAILLIFIGEALAIYAEMIMAKNSFALINFFKLFVLIAVGGIFLLFGYKFGFDNFKNIWIVSVTSITSILVIEPALAYYVFGQLPTRGALVGLIFGVLGFISTLILY